MLVIPAIDLMGGEAVRLEKGDFATKKVYAKDPAEKAAEFRDAGATLLHVVDLDGARAGWPVNLDTVAAICRVKGIEIELGGGIRTLLDVEKVLALGVSYVVLEFFMGTNLEGAEQVLHCALSPEVEKRSGRFYHRFQEHPPNPLAEDGALCAELYRRSEAMVAQALKAREAAPSREATA
jgi:hypothetical protein